MLVVRRDCSARTSAGACLSATVDAAIVTRPTALASTSFDAYVPSSCSYSLHASVCVEPHGMITASSATTRDCVRSRRPGSAASAPRAAPHRRRHRVLLHPARRRRGDAGAGAAQPEALPRLGAQGRRRRTAGADRGRAGPRRGPRLRARLGPPGAHPRRTPPPLGGAAGGLKAGKYRGRQVEASRGADVCTSSPSCPRDGAGRRYGSRLIQRSVRAT